MDSSVVNDSGAQGPPAWLAQQRHLWVWYSVYLAMWIGFFLSMALGNETLGGVLMVGSLIPYVLSLVLAYKIEKQLYESKLDPYSHRWILAWGIILTPWILGFSIPLTVIIKARKAMRKLQAK